MQQPYRLVTLGGLRLERAPQGGGGVVTGVAAQQRALAVLAAVAVAGVRGVSRDWLVALLWPESEEERARHVLAQLLYNLRRGLEPHAPVAGAARQLWLDLSVVHADVGAFQDALREGDDARAVALYGGPFLDGVHLTGAPQTFEEWVDGERARLAALYRGALAREAERLAAAGDLAEAAAHRRRLVDLDPLDPHATLRLMETLAMADDAAGAVEAARRHALRRRADLDAPPDPAVEALAERIRRAADARAAAERAARPTPGPVHAAAVQRAARMPAATPAPEPEPEPENVHAPAPAPVRARTRWLPRAGLAAVGALALLALVTRLPSRAGAAPPRSVAVRPFTPVGGDTASRYFGDGVAEELLVELQHVDSLTVASRSMSFALRDSTLDAREVGRRLRVASVVEGTVRRVGGRVRVAVQLVGTADGYALWSSTYDGSLSELEMLQARIARDVAGALRVRLAPMSRRGGTDPETYDLYLRGRYAWWNTSTLAGERAAEQYFLRAIARDSTFAPAYVGLADALFEQTAYHPVAPGTVVPRARAALERALALDPALVDAHASMGYLLTFHEWRWDEADAELRRAIELDPRHVRARLWRAWLLSAAGRNAEAVAEVRRAQALDPLDPLVATRVATMLYFAGDLPASIAHARGVLESHPGYWLAHRQLGESLVQAGQAAAGVAELRAAAAVEPTPETRARLAYGLARADSVAAARALLDSLEEEARTEYISPVELARVRLGLGDRARALADLARAREVGSSMLVVAMGDPTFASLREEPGFRGLLPAWGQAGAATPR